MKEIYPDPGFLLFGGDMYTHGDLTEDMLLSYFNLTISQF